MERKIQKYFVIMDSDTDEMLYKGNVHASDTEVLDMYLMENAKCNEFSTYDPEAFSKDDKLVILKYIGVRLCLVTEEQITVVVHR